MDLEYLPVDRSESRRPRYDADMYYLTSYQYQNIWRVTRFELNE